MKKMCKLQLFALASLIAITLWNTTNSFAAQLTGEKLLPEIPKKIIASAYSGFRVVENDDIDWSSSGCEFSSKYQTVIKADFNGDGVDDYTVLLFGTKRESKKSWWKFGESSQSQLKLVVFLGERSGSFKNIQIAEQKQNITDMACDDTA